MQRMRTAQQQLTAMLTSSCSTPAATSAVPPRTHTRFRQRGDWSEKRGVGGRGIVEFANRRGLDYALDHKHDLDIRQLGSPSAALGPWPSAGPLGGSAATAAQGTPGQTS